MMMMMWIAIMLTTIVVLLALILYRLTGIFAELREQTISQSVTYDVIVALWQHVRDRG